MGMERQVHHMSDAKRTYSGELLVGWLTRSGDPVVQPTPIVNAFKIGHESILFCDMLEGCPLRAALDRPRPSLLVFDCDGVLVDSELIDSRIRAVCFQAEGFPVTF